jgi:hypothetical protein
MSDRYIREAFDVVISDAVKTETWYVSLVEEVTFYGGPEEGGWWGHDYIVHSYKEFPSETLARIAADAVTRLATDLSYESRKAHNQQCLREMAWCDARGLDADYLPEPDGESKFHVYVTDEIPENSYASRHYC